MLMIEDATINSLTHTLRKTTLPRQLGVALNTRLPDRGQALRKL